MRPNIEYLRQRNGRSMRGEYLYTSAHGDGMRWVPPNIIISADPGRYSRIVSTSAYSQDSTMKWHRARCHRGFVKILRLTLTSAPRVDKTSHMECEFSSLAGQYPSWFVNSMRYRTLHLMHHGLGCRSIFFKLARSIVCKRIGRDSA